ncbi:BA75_00725T0 [Komagataella pastoris]|uniref:BA75_00725T0 n=1 Tax=Komagataella pastoris TaxID=4922 RepID=A0A1B2J5W1_PICPA|nr:BA75_00725T0 [Komagataella pastoris]
MATAQILKFYLELVIIWWFLIYASDTWSAYRTIKKCSWKNWEKWPAHSTPHRSLVYADPQLVDDYSYPERPQLINYFTKKLSDHYLHRNYMIVNELLRPDSIFFLGDLFDGGREHDGDDVWFKEYKRFNRIFPKFPNVRINMALPGNHDIGFGNEVDLDKLMRFRTFFGDVNTFDLLGNHSFILVDSISLSSQSQPLVTNDPRWFLENLTDSLAMQYPRILFTHVPLFRDPDQQTCGPLREHNKQLFPIQKGYQYQTVIDPDLSKFILAKSKPSLVLSGDDHDYCHIQHEFTDLGTKGTVGEDYCDEITVKACSMTGGISKPAIQLLSLYNNLDINSRLSSNTIQQQMCLLPSPFGAVKFLAFAYAATLLLALRKFKTERIYFHAFAISTIIILLIFNH